ncbi:MAG: hypothetical protein RL497_701 [Pseudomonadota bacterium]
MHNPLLNNTPAKPNSVMQELNFQRHTQKTSISDFSQVLQQQEAARISERTNNQERLNYKEAANHRVESNRETIKNNQSDASSRSETNKKETIIRKETVSQKESFQKPSKTDTANESKEPTETTSELFSHKEPAEIDANSAAIEDIKSIFKNIMPADEDNLSLLNGFIQEEETPLWSFWLQHVQEVASGNVDKPAEIGGEILKVLVPISDAENIMASQANTSLIYANTPELTQAITPSAQVLSQQKTPLTVPVPAVSDDQLTLSVVSATVTDNTENTENTDDTEALTTFATLINQTSSAVSPALKGVSDTLNTAIRDLSQLEGRKIDGSALEPAPTPSTPQDSKWVNQVDTSSLVASQAIEDKNKSFFQLRFNQQQLAPDLAEKTGWMIKHKLDTAEIQLDPPELGPITVKIHTHQEQVSVTFIVNNPQVREAMDQTMQRLKDLLQEQGVMLAHSDVNGQRQQRDDQTQGHLNELDAPDVHDDEPLIVSIPTADQVVDYFV